VCVPIGFISFLYVVPASASSSTNHVLGLEIVAMHILFSVIDADLPFYPRIFMSYKTSNEKATAPDKHAYVGTSGVRTYIGKKATMSVPKGSGTLSKGMLEKGPKGIETLSKGIGTLV
jgi:hypothetical protein